MGTARCIGCGRKYKDIEAHLAASQSCSVAREHQAQVAAARVASPRKRCPKCRSESVSDLEGWYEFTNMQCLSCGHEELCDTYQQDAWWS